MAFNSLELKFKNKEDRKLIIEAFNSGEFDTEDYEFPSVSKSGSNGIDIDGPYGHLFEGDDEIPLSVFKKIASMVSDEGFWGCFEFSGVGPSIYYKCAYQNGDLYFGDTGWAEGRRALETFPNIDYFGSITLFKKGENGFSTGRSSNSKTKVTGIIDDIFGRKPKPAAQKAKPAAVNGASLNGLTVVVTGDLDGFTRSEFKTFVEGLGGKVTGSVSGKTNYLICNDTSSGTTKVYEAQSRGVPVISEEEFMELIKKSDSATASKSPAAKKTAKKKPALAGSDLPQKVTFTDSMKNEWTFNKIKGNTYEVEEFKGDSSEVEIPAVCGDQNTPVTQIGEGAFEENKKLEKIIISENVREIGRFAFQKCRKLKEVILPNGPVGIGYDAFGVTEFMDSAK